MEQLITSEFSHLYLFSSAFNLQCNKRRGLTVHFSKKKVASSGESAVLFVKESKQNLSRKLREEAAILNVERKAGSAKYKNLWPKAVLEALDDAIFKKQWESALKIFKLLRSQHWYQPKSRTYAKMLTMLGKCKQIEQARSLFQIMQSEGLKPTLDVYTSLAGAYGHAGYLDRALDIIDEMKTLTNCKPDAYTYTILINCCCKRCEFDKIPTLLEDMSYLGIECNTVTYNAIIDGYGKAGMIEEMESNLSNMLETGSCLPDIVTMNSILWAYGNNGRIIEMEKWYNEFLHMGIDPDITTFNILVKSYGKATMYKKIESVLKFMKERFFTPTTITYNTIIECFGKANNIEKMEYYFRLMKVQGIKPNSITYCSLVSAYSKAGLLDMVPAIIRQTENTDVVLDAAFFNCVINAYAEAGHIDIMEDMFLVMKEKDCMPDNITYLTMIKAYNLTGMYEAAKELESKVKDNNIRVLESG